MQRPLTEHIDPGGEPLDLQAYEAVGGYQALRKALREFTPEEVTEEVTDSNLKGRGGAGFGTGQKWSFVPMGEDAPHPKYIIANADEMEPGTFKDRYLMEGNPHQLVEGLIISAYALQADVAFIFLRWAYKKSERLLREAIAAAEEAGYLGEDILGSGWSLDMRIHVSAGRYMCGEETGLLNALEGKRATPRAKPPYPQTSGLWGQPTIVQNVETLCCVPHIVAKGAQWFKDLSLTDEGGTKLFGASGKVKRPGLWELPLGTPLGEIFEEHAGGMQEGYEFRGCLPGGASTDFLTREHFEVQMGFSAVMEAGSRLGTGMLVVLDDKSCPVGMVLNLERFFARESCGWCTPCRDGLPWVERTLAAIESGHGEPQDLEVLEAATEHLGPGRTYCMLAPGAMEPLQSALEFFRDDFERHIDEGGCWY